MERLEVRKEAMISALWSNSNYDSQAEGEEAPRNAIIEEIENNFSEAVKMIMGGAVAAKEESESERPDDDPYGFFAAGRRGEAKIYKVLEEQKSTDASATVEDVIQYDKEVDQG